MQAQQTEVFRVLARTSAHEHTIEELSAAELAEVSGAGCTGTASAKTTSGGGKPDDKEVSVDMSCSQ